jgi:hypothetical protein
MSESPADPEGEEQDLFAPLDAETEEMISEMAELRNLSREEYLRKLIIRDLADARQERVIKLRGKRAK